MRGRPGAAMNACMIEDPRTYTPAIAVYALYGGGFVLPILAVAGLVLAYVRRGEHPGVDTHLTFAIRTFWTGLVMVLVGGLLTLVLIGYLVLLFWALWTITRCVSGFILANGRQPVSRVDTLGMVAR